MGLTVEKIEAAAGALDAQPIMPGALRRGYDDDDGSGSGGDVGGGAGGDGAGSAQDDLVDPNEVAVGPVASGQTGLGQAAPVIGLHPGIAMQPVANQPHLFMGQDGGIYRSVPLVAPPEPSTTEEPPPPTFPPRRSTKRRPPATDATFWFITSSPMISKLSPAAAVVQPIA